MAQLCEIFNSVGPWLNSAFTTSLVGAGAGAWWGARAAQKSAAKDKRVDEALREYRALNSALVLAGVACDTAFAYKHQIAQPLFDRFERDKKRYVDHVRSGHPRNTVPDGISFPTQVVKPNAFYESELRKLFMEQTLAPPRLLGYVNILCKHIDLFQSALETREELVSRTSAAINANDPTLPQRYFSLTDETSPDELNAWELVLRCDEIMVLIVKIDEAVNLRKAAIAINLKNDGQRIPDGHSGSLSLDKMRRSEVFPQDFKNFRYLAGGFEGEASPTTYESLRKSRMPGEAHSGTSSASPPK